MEADVLSEESAYGLWLAELPLEERVGAFDQSVLIELTHRELVGDGELADAHIVAWVSQWALRVGSPPERAHVHARFGEEEIARRFGDFEELADLAGLNDSAYVAALDSLGQLSHGLREEAAEDRRVLDRERRAMQRERKKVADLDRRRRTAERKRKEAEKERDAARSERRKLERELAKRPEPAVATPAAVPPKADDSSQAEKAREALAAEEAFHARTREERDLAQAEADRLAGEVRTSNRVAAALRARLRDLGDRAEPEAMEPPHTVLEAVQRACSDSAHLVFTERALDTAADSPFRRPDDIYEALMRLDDVAADYLAGEIGMSTRERAATLGLDWRTQVSPTAVAKARTDYHFRHHGREWLMGEHVVVGNGSGAGLCARIYLHFHPGDADHERTVLVGAVGRHLPDSTT